MVATHSISGAKVSVGSAKSTSVGSLLGLKGPLPTIFRLSQGTHTHSRRQRSLGDCHVGTVPVRDSD